jgi:hypothetical protein
MLFSTLLLMCVSVPVQDPPAAPATQDAAPAAPAVPAETPASVRTYLTEAQSHLYDPQAAGLKSLAFDVDIEMPQIGTSASCTSPGTPARPRRRTSRPTRPRPCRPARPPG